MPTTLLKYSLLRLGLFTTSLLVLFLFGVEGVPLLVLAAVISLVLSYILLRSQRDQVAAEIEQRITRRMARGSGADADAAAEDGTTTERS